MYNGQHGGGGENVATPFPHSCRKGVRTVVKLYVVMHGCKGAGTTWVHTSTITWLNVRGAYCHADFAASQSSAEKDSNLYSCAFVNKNFGIQLGSNMRRIVVLMATDSWCLCKLVYWEGENVVNYIIACKFLSYAIPKIGEKTSN